MLEKKSSWQVRAACRGTVSPDEFFSEVAISKETCRKCPVIELCKLYAIAHEEYGIWGGTSRYERQKLGKVYRDAIRQIYLDAGLLEWRPWTEEFLVQKVVPLQEQSDPISLLEVS